jgi:hypothetical protein
MASGDMLSIYYSFLIFLDSAVFIARSIRKTRFNIDVIGFKNGCPLKRLIERYSTTICFDLTYLYFIKRMFYVTLNVAILIVTTSVLAYAARFPTC